MRRILGLLLVLHIANFALAQEEFNLNQVEPDSTEYYVKLPYEDINGKLIVKAEVGGKQRRFILNTGATTCISRVLADELVLLEQKIGEEEESETEENSKQDSLLSFIVLDKVVFDTTAFRNVPALVFEESIFFDCFKVDGFIGSNMLQKSIIQFSKKDSTITITNQPNLLRLNKKSSTKLYFEKEQSIPYFYAKLGKTRLRFLFDSGSNELISMSSDDFFKLQNKNIFQILGSAYGSVALDMFNVAENVEMYRLYLPRFIVGSSRLANAIIHTAESKSRMGVKLLNYGTVTVDYVGRKLYFEPNNTDRPYTNVREQHWTVSASIQDGLLTVGTVWDNLGQNINQGDRIIAIDGVGYKQRSLCDILLRPLIDKRKNEALLTIENKDGVRRNVKIIKQ